MDGVRKPVILRHTARRFLRSGEVKLTQIRDAVTNAGDTAGTGGEETRDLERVKSERARKVMRMRLIVAIVFAEDVSLHRMSHMCHRLGVPLPAFLSPHMHPLTFAS